MSAFISIRRFTAGLIMSGAILLLTACGGETDKAPEHSLVTMEQTSAPANEQISVNKNESASLESSHTQVIPDTTTSKNSSSSMDKSSTSASKGSMAAAAPSNKIGLLEWEHPTERANGEYLELEDIAGYELRYRRDNEHYQSLVIHGSKTTFYKIPPTINGMKIQIAVFDTNGLYSEFVDISPSIN